jgi:hypothetical protein
MARLDQKLSLQFRWNGRPSSHGTPSIDRSYEAKFTTASGNSEARQRAAALSSIFSANQLLHHLAAVDYLDWPGAGGH